MSISEIFVRRRTGTVLLALGLVFIGINSYFLLPVAPIPQVEFPTIQVSANLPGASALVMASSVATPLERSLSNVPGITQMTSSSSLGTSQITLQFDLNRAIDGAAQDVQTAISAASGLLPKNLPNPPTYKKTNPADLTVLTLALTSDTLPLTEVDRYAEDFIAQQVSQMPGVGLVDFHGHERPAVRVRLDPDKVAQLGLTFEDIRGIISVQTVNSPKGSLTGPDRAVIVDATDQVMTADAYKQIVVAYKQGGPIRLEDLGIVVDAPEDTQQAAWLQGKQAVIIDVHKQPGYNVVETIDQIKARLPQLAAALPPAATLSLVGDRTRTIRAAVTDVQVTLLITVVLVVLVIFFFVRNLWATVIPSVAIPLSLVSAFGVMYALDYSLDNISLMGMTIAVGFVVDDAIVVVENVMRHIEDGKRPVQAAIEGAQEVSFTIISMTVSLIAVFIPILLMGGIIGRLFREFAVTVTMVILMSGIVSLTVTPMMCAWLIRHDPHAGHGRLFMWSERLFNATTAFYQRTLDRVLAHPVATLAATVATLILSMYLYAVTPKGFFPTVDTGFISGTVQAAPDISFAAMSSRMQAIGRICSEDPDVEVIYSWIGNNPTMSQGRININLKPAEERHSNATEIMARLKKKTAGVAGATLFMQVRQDIQMGGRVTATQYQYTLQDGDIDELTRWSQMLLEKFSSMPELRDVSSDAQSLASNITIRIDRDTASRLGISAQAIDDVLYDAFGQRQIATLFTQLNQYHVIEEIDPRYQVNSDSLGHLYVRATNGSLVPLSVLASVQPGLAPIAINHQGLFPAITLSYNLAPGVSLGQAVEAIQAVERAANKPATLTTSFQGTAQAFQDSLRTQPWLILIALVAVYIVLGVLYESAIHPLTIISTLPSAGVGALLALLLCGQDLSIMGMVGIILLIGIVKKNAIMIIDFALAAEREEGLAPQAAIRQGCILRFRPIMMTTLAALFGAVPLALGAGVGAELRVPLGIAIIGGLIVSQVLTLYATPVIYLWFGRLARIRAPQMA
jgi:multidrug efflux pump